VSLDAQQAKLRASGVIRDVEMEIITDVASGKDTMRHGMSTILTAIEAGEVASVTVCKLDRLTRSLADLLQVIDLCRSHGVALVSLSEALDTSTPTGKLVVHILGAVSQWERETIALRTKDALQWKRDSGLVAGTVPYGFDRVDSVVDAETGKLKGGRIVRNEAEYAVACRIVGLVDADWTLRDIAKLLNDEGIPAKKGGRWHISTLGRLIGHRHMYESAGRMPVSGDVAIEPREKVA